LSLDKFLGLVYYPLKRTVLHRSRDYIPLRPHTPTLGSTSPKRLERSRNHYAVLSELHYGGARRHPRPRRYAASGIGDDGRELFAKQRRLNHDRRHRSGAGSRHGRREPRTRHGCREERSVRHNHRQHAADWALQCRLAAVSYGLNDAPRGASLVRGPS